MVLLAKGRETACVIQKADELSRQNQSFSHLWQPYDWRLAEVPEGTQKKPWKPWYLFSYLTAPHIPLKLLIVSIP